MRASRSILDNEMHLLWQRLETRRPALTFKQLESLLRRLPETASLAERRYRIDLLDRRTFERRQVRQSKLQRFVERRNRVHSREEF